MAGDGRLGQLVRASYGAHQQTAQAWGMKYQEALIAWTPDTDHIRVGPLIRLGQIDEHGIEHGGDVDWTEHPYRYARTGGAAEVALRHLPGQTQARHDAV